MWARGAPVVDRITRARTISARLVGLLANSGLPPGRGLHISPCRAVHTWGMRFDLDLVFLDREEVVVRICRDVPPWRIAWGGPRARSVVEIAAGWLPRAALAPGDQVQWLEPGGKPPATLSKPAERFPAGRCCPSRDSW